MLSSSINNGSKLSGKPQKWIKIASLDSNVILGGQETKDMLYESKHNKNLVRVLTVVAYIFFVSFVGVMLSLYYVFLWTPDIIEFDEKICCVITQPTCKKNDKCACCPYSKCDKEICLFIKSFQPTCKEEVKYVSKDGKCVSCSYCRK